MKIEIPEPHPAYTEQGRKNDALLVALMTVVRSPVIDMVHDYRKVLEDMGYTIRIEQIPEEDACGE